MAQTKNKRKRKHRGTAAGTIDRPARTGRGQVKKDSKTIAKERRAERMQKEPTWKGAVNRAAIAAVVFTVLMFLIRSDQGAVANVSLGFLVFLFYIPLGYLTDRAIYNFRRRKQS